MAGADIVARRVPRPCRILAVSSNHAGVVKLADARDSKSRGLRAVRVRPPPPAPCLFAIQQDRSRVSNASVGLKRSSVMIGFSPKPRATSGFVSPGSSAAENTRAALDASQTGDGPAVRRRRRGRGVRVFVAALCAELAARLPPLLSSSVGRICSGAGVAGCRVAGKTLSPFQAQHRADPDRARIVGCARVRCSPSAHSKNMPVQRSGSVKALVALTGWHAG